MRLVLALVFALSLLNVVPVRAQDGDQVRLGADLVEVRAVVTDKKGNLVRGLTKDDFVVLDAGKLQELSFFSQEQIEQPPARATSAAAATTGTDALPPLPPVRTVVLFVDDLHLEPLSLASVRDALKKFIASSVSERDLLGIVTATGKVRLFGQFGADRSVLDEAIDAIPLGPRDWWPSRFTPFLAGLIRQDPRDEAYPVIFGARLLKEQEHVGSASSYEASAVDRSYIEKAKHTAREVLLQAAVRRKASLDALKILCDQLADLPGQRLVVEFTDGFTLRDFDGFPAGEELRIVASHAARAGVVINEVIATGLAVQSGISPEYGSLPSPQEYAYSIQNERGSSRDLESGAAGLAKATGGELFADNNDLAGRARAVLERNNAYYALAYYAPDASTADFRAVEVKVKNHPEYDVRAQGGYLPLETRAKAGPKETDPTSRLADSVLTPNVPRELDVSLQLSGVERAEKKSSRVSLAARVGGDGVQLVENAGRYGVSIDVATVVFDLAGKLVFASSDHIGGSLSPEDAEKASEAGFRYKATTDPLPPGVYQARIAFLDSASGRLGARAIWLHIPNPKS